MKLGQARLVPVNESVASVEDHLPGTIKLRINETSRQRYWLLIRSSHLYDQVLKPSLLTSQPLSWLTQLEREDLIEDGETP